MADVVGDEFDSSKKLTLSDIKVLGGEKEDLDLIDNDVDDDFEEIVKDDDTDSDDEPLSKLELRDFIKKLGFKEIPNKLTIIKDEDDVKEENVKEDGENQLEKVVKTKKDKKMERNAKYNIVEKVPAQPTTTATGPPKEHKNRNYMLAKPETKWYENEVSVQAEDVSFSKLPLPKVMELENYAAKLLQDDIELYQKYQRSAKNRSNFHWIQTVLKSGTTSDKMAAYIVLVQDSAVHNLSHLDQLIKMIDVKRKGECLMAIDTLKDLFIGDLLLENKKLRSFDQQPLGSLNSMSAGNADAYNKLLLLWHFESCLKQKYAQFVSAIVKVSHDSVDAHKRKALKAMFDMLLKNPEQEQILLNSIVNKLGDPNHKVASQTSYFLCRMLDSHPNMKAIIVNEVERLLFRPNISPKASYFAVCFLNQIILDVEDREVAAKLTSIYFALFRGSTKKGEVDSKMMTALLTGANRAFPYAKLDSATISEHIDATYKIIPTMNFNIGIQALTLLYHVLDSKDDFSDRFYCSLYRKLLDPELKSTSKQTMFINLLYKSLKRDYSERRLQAFVKRIFQIAHEQNPSMTCGLLFLVSEVLRQSKRSLTLVHEQNRWGDDDGEEKLTDVQDEEEEEGQISKSTTIAKSEVPDISKVGSSWVHRTNIHPVNKDSTVQVDQKQCSYDPLHRNPLYAIVGKVCPWELLKLASHYHPSVALFAKTLLDGNYIKYSGDPLQDFTLSRFLDRFVYRNPKKLSQKASGEEEIDTVTSQRSILGKRSLYKPKGARALPVDSTTYANKPEDTIPVDERFMYKYFSNKRQIEAVGAIESKNTLEEDDEDIESVASDEFETLMDKFQSGDLKAEYEIDFAAQVKKGLAQTAGKKSKNEEDDSDGSNDDDDEIDFENNEFDDAFRDFDEDIAEAKADAEESDEEFSDLESEVGVKSKNDVESESNIEEDDDEDDYPQQSKRSRPSKEEDTQKLFASAEQFASVLEENTSSKGAFSGLEAFANKDNAHLKQLKWEAERDKWVRGVDWKSKRNTRKKMGNKSSKNNRKFNKFNKRKGRK